MCAVAKKKKRPGAHYFKTQQCPLCEGQIKLRTSTRYFEAYPDGVVLTVSDTLALPQCGTCREVFLNARYEKMVEKDLRLSPEGDL